MNKDMSKKGLALGMIILFIGTGFIPSTIGTIEKKTTFTVSSSRGYIQNLIDNASDGDTIYIPSGIYYENVVINKSISLLGEDKETTIIDGSGNGDVVCVVYNAYLVNISGFTIQNSGEEDYDAGIEIYIADNNIITDNIIANNRYGIFLKSSSFNNINRNTISNNIYGIYLNHIVYFYMWWGYINSHENNVIKNNFIGNRIHASFLLMPCKNDWNSNYWENWKGYGQKFIFGRIGIFYGRIPWINFDWHPAKEPYDI